MATVLSMHLLIWACLICHHCLCDWEHAIAWSPREGGFSDPAWGTGRATADTLFSQLNPWEAWEFVERQHSLPYLPRSQILCKHQWLICHLLLGGGGGYVNQIAWTGLSSPAGKCMTILMQKRVSLPKNDNFVIIYSTACRFKSCMTFFCRI